MPNLPEIPPSIDNAINNLAAPITKGVGETLADLWFLAVGSVSHAAEKRRIKYAADLQKLKQQTEESVLNIKPEDRKEPNIQVSLQTLEKAKYCAEEEILRKMFAELLASSMMKSREDIIHPSFPELLSQLSADDARTFDSFAVNQSQPILSIKIENTKSSQFLWLIKDIFFPYNTLSNFEKGSYILNSLSRLGLIEYSYDNYFTDSKKYDIIYTPYVQSVVASKFENELNLENKSEWIIRLHKGIMSITTLGKNFMRCVNPDYHS